MMTDFLGKERFASVVIVLVAILTAYNFGYAAAEYKTDFLTEGSFAIVAIFGDSFVMLEKRPQTDKPGQFIHGPTMKIIRMGDDSRLTFKPETLKAKRVGEGAWWQRWLLKW
jgi:hypothetical protein